MKVFSFIGKAGTGKTQILTRLLSEVINKKRNNCYVCANTHSAVNNIRQRIKSNLPGMEIEDKYINTIYSIFAINYVKQIVNGLILPFTSNEKYHIFIDEFSLIPLILFNRIMLTLERYENLDISVYVFGDPLQLGPVVSDNCNMISFTDIDNWINDIDNVRKLHESEIQREYDIKDMLNVIHHFHNTTFISDYIRKSTRTILTQQFRANDYVSNVLRNIYVSDDDNFNYDIVTDINDLRDLIRNEKYVFISSKYKYLQKIVNIVGGNNRIKNSIHKQALKEIRLNVGQTCIIHETLKTSKKEIIYFNNERMIFKDYDDKRDVVHVLNERGNELCLERNDDKTFYITPDYVSTIHKSQGQTIDNVIVCLDDLYDFSMLYTAITRAKNNIKFFTFTNEHVPTLIQKVSAYQSYNLAELIIEHQI